VSLQLNLQQIKESLNSEEQWSQSGIGYHKIEWMVSMLEDAENMAYRIQQSIYGPRHEQQSSLESIAMNFLLKLRGEK